MEQRRTLRAFWTRPTTVEFVWTPELLRDAFLPIVYGYCLTRLSHRDDAEDAAVEVFSAVALGKSVPTPEDEARAFLLGIARRKVADALRRRARQSRDRETETLPPLGLETGILTEEAAREIRAVVDSLPADQREALLLKYVERLSTREIGKTLNRSEPAVSSLLQRARAAAHARGRAYFLEDETL